LAAPGADLAHELRAPLATIEAYHEGLGDGVVEVDAATHAVLEEATGRLQRLVEDLSLVSRAEEGQLALELSPLDVREIVRAAVDSVAPDAREREVELQQRLPDRPLAMDGDRDRLTQVLSTSCATPSNTPPQGAASRSRWNRSTTRSAWRSARTGAGIAPEHLPQVFERFFRADPARRHVAGSGIGLTISRAIVQGHGGTITVHSHGPGRGATLTVRLPLRGS
jgi:two-component system, OmpR family, sensor histidine kinase BaeS